MLKLLDLKKIRIEWSEAQNKTYNQKFLTDFAYKYFESLLAQCEKYKEVLEFYSNKNNYTSGYGYSPWSIITETDKGIRARIVLGKEGENNGKSRR